MTRGKRRIAFFGGSFDPVHNGHLEMAEAAARQLGLHQVCFVPTSANPLKSEGPRASPADRLAMLRLALAEEPRFSVWEGEIHGDGPGFTVDSAGHLERVYPNCHLFWIIGSDQLPQLPHWRSVGELVRKVGFILVRRPGHPFLWPGLPGLHLYPVDNPLNPVSSTEIRRQAAAGELLTGSVPPAVAHYLYQNHLYR